MQKKRKPGEHGPMGHYAGIEISYRGEEFAPITGMREEDRLKQKSKNASIIQQAIADGKNNFIFAWLDIKVYPLNLMETFANYIAVLYKNGGVELLPRGVKGHEMIRDVLGVKFNQVTHWYPIPIKRKPHNLFTVHDIHTYE